ncbi:MAG: hypothetical protein E7292_09955 [Lachnospiraceae bacterium]|nr:hypothetical protein [Lachnospiraceae bacterium]
MKRKHFIFTNKKHSERAIMATILGLISNASIGIVIYLTYLKGGDAPISYGLTGLLATIFSVVGLILGILTAQEKEMFQLFPILGILLNLIALGIMMFVVQLGF